MSSRRTIRVACGVFVLVASATVSSIPALADSTSDLTQTLANLHPGVSVTEIRTQADSIAKQEGRPIDEVLSALIQEVKDAHPVASNKRVIDTAPNSSSGGGNATAILGTAKYGGDIFYSPAKTALIPHGHVGIYYGTSTIVEAPGSGQNSRSAYAKEHKVPPGSEKMWVNGPVSMTVAAGKYAYDHLRNKPYNYNFASNKYVIANSYNCSQLVWAAYKATSNVDLDSNGGWGVYPSDIKNSPLTYTYETVW